MAILLFRLVQIVFTTYTFLLIIRIIASWFPSLFKYRIMHFIMFYTDPYLNLFRKIIPPIGGTLDISPIIAFFALRILERVVLYLLTYIF